MKCDSDKPARGRPRCFDENVALEAALQVFWEKGYEGTSLPDLTTAMGISRPSLYAAFGNKEQLFRRVMDLYASRASEQLGSCPGSARDLTQRMLESALGSRGKCARACFFVSSAMSVSEENTAIAQELSARRRSGQKLLRDRYRVAQKAGEMKGIDIDALSLFYATILHGLAVQLAGGATATQLRGVVEAAMRAWPR